MPDSQGSRYAGMPQEQLEQLLAKTVSREQREAILAELKRRRHEEIETRIQRVYDKEHSASLPLSRPTDRAPPQPRPQQVRPSQPPLQPPLQPVQMREAPCKKCNGAGRVKGIFFMRKCPNCGGSGLRRDEVKRHLAMFVFAVLWVMFMLGVLGSIFAAVL